MDRDAIFSGAFTSDNNFIKVRLPLIIFSEDNTQIVYCPALDVSGYGNNEPEAKESFEVSLGEFFRYTLNKKTLSSELTKLGWKMHGKHKPANPPSMQQLLEENDNFSRIFNNHDFRKVEQQFEIPVA